MVIFLLSVSWLLESCERCCVCWLAAAALAAQRSAAFWQCRDDRSLISAQACGKKLRPKPS